MAISVQAFFKHIRDLERKDYERRIASGETERLPYELECILYEFQDTLALSCGGRIPVKAIDAKAREISELTGISTAEIKAHALGPVGPADDWTVTPY